MGNKLKLISQSKNQISNHAFRTYYYKYSQEEGRDIYIIELISNVLVKVSTYIRSFRIRELATESLMKNVGKVLGKEINADNSIIYIVYDVKKGIGFVPDLNLLQRSLEGEKALENKYNIVFGGSVGIYQKQQARSLEMVQSMGDYYYATINVAVVFSFDEALEKIDSFRLKNQHRDNAINA